MFDSCIDDEYHLSRNNPTMNHTDYLYDRPEMHDHIIVSQNVSSAPYWSFHLKAGILLVMSFSLLLSSN